MKGSLEVIISNWNWWAVRFVLINYFMKFTSKMNKTYIYDNLWIKISLQIWDQKVALQIWWCLRVLTEKYNTTTKLF